MSILIKGMDMPKDCPMCPMAHWNACDEFTGCGIVAGKKYANKTDPKYMKSTCRPDWCPLVEVKPHGRLIDADELNNMINQSYPMTDRVDVHNGYAIVQEMMKQLPTIIESEGEE